MLHMIITKLLLNLFEGGGERKERREFILDFTGDKYITEVHWKIRDTFHFPGFCGENLSALWDMECDYIGSDDEVFDFVRIKGVHTLPKEHYQVSKHKNVLKTES